MSGTGALAHAGSGTLVLNGANSFSGATTVSAGTLLVNGSLGTNAVNVAAGAALGGYGAIGGPVTIASGGSLALGSSLGSLTVGSTLTLSGDCVMKISKSGTTLSNDSIQGLAVVTYGGNLNVLASGTPLAAGDSFRLFSATAYAGAFAVTNLPTLGTNLHWDLSGLTNGTLAVAIGNPSGRPDGPPAASFNTFTHLPDGTSQMTFSGTPGYGYRLWASTNLAWSPITNTWSNVASGTFSGSAVFFTDTQTTNLGSRFYSISVP